MIKRLLWPLIKRFKGLFISMCFVSMLAIGLLMAFTNVYINLGQTYPAYIEKYNAASLTISTDLKDMSGDIEDVKNLNGVEQAEYRLSFDCYLKKEDGRQITSRIFTYREDNEINRLFFKERKVEVPNDLPYIYVESRFAKNNNFKAGDEIALGAFGLYIPFRIREIVQGPETIYIRVKDYIWSDNTDFGTLYIDPTQAKILVKNLGDKIRHQMDIDPDFKYLVESILETTEAIFPDYKNLITDDDIVNFIENFGNQVLTVNQKGTNNDEVGNRVKALLEEKGYKVNDVRPIQKSTSYMYMNSALSQLKIAAIFLPAFFFVITLFVIVLFINQMVKSMTSDIGIMMSIGIQGKEITGLFSIFIFAMSMVSSGLGLGIAAILMKMLTTAMLSIYQMPYIMGGFNVFLLLGGILALVLLGQGAVLIASRSIYRITPKDAMLSNESKRKHLPKWANKVIDKSPMTIKLGLNSVLQNLRRFFVSVFSIFAALTMTMLTMMFVDAKNSLINQSLKYRLSYDCQVYLSEKITDEKYEEIKNQEFVSSITNGYFTYLEITNGDRSVLAQTVALDEDCPKDLFYIPDGSGKKDMEITGTGIILDKVTASKLKVKKGDSVIINNVSVTVDNISYQYFNMCEYISKTTFETLDVQSASTLFINTSNETALLDYLSESGGANLTVFSSSLRKDMNDRLSPINIFAYIMIAFSLGMGFMILVIMTQNALMEQKRALSIFRAVGFKVTNVSNIWMTQSFLQLLFSNLFAIPTSFLFIYILLTSASSATQIYPFIINPWTVLICFGFILAVIGLAHLFAMNVIARWNLADNTRSRE